MTKKLLHGQRRIAPWGFTIVELLVVIVVIAILATIIILSYRGITQQATEASMRTDIDNARNAIAILKAGQKNYPATADAANDGQGLKTSGNNSIIYGALGTAYCVSTSNPGTSKKFQFYSPENVIKEGSCGGTISTIAGTPTYSGGVVDGTGTAATFGWPASMTADKLTGDLIVGDCGSSVRRVTKAGVVTTIAGDKNNYGYADGPAASARFTCIEDLTMGPDGTIYLVDSGTYSGFIGVRRITPGGTVETIAGSATRGHANGTGTAAQFYRVAGIARDLAGNLYVAEPGDTGDMTSLIRKVTPAGVVTTFAGGASGYAEGTGTAAQFNDPRGIAIDSSGNLYIADSRNQRIRKITPAGVVTTFAGSGSPGMVDGTGAAAQFDYPHSISIDKDNNLYVGDNVSVRKITPAGVVTTLVGTREWGYNDGLGIFSLVGWPEGIVVDADGTIYLADADNYVIRKIKP